MIPNCRSCYMSGDEPTSVHAIVGSHPLLSVTISVVIATGDEQLS